MVAIAARQMVRSLLPRAVLNWREAQYYGRHGEVELHLLEFLCRRDQDAIDIGANFGGYVHFMRRHARRVLAYEPMPDFVRAAAGKISTRCRDRLDRPFRPSWHRRAADADYLMA